MQIKNLLLMIIKLNFLIIYRIIRVIVFGTFVVITYLTFKYPKPFVLETIKVFKNSEIELSVSSFI